MIREEESLKAGVANGEEWTSTAILVERNV